ncbi:hypothetical protein PANDA_020687 [Ailuropoda melanoleuca]|uniref:Helicase C-terminal domain-containing protein n=1 Tax=Ailuropoda melanoleuca TaxID=9646 RepID=D2I4X7_AILME|nr:hypothetical protein PANDA_020687 [Ailuropoda melanoleuca]
MERIRGLGPAAPCQALAIQSTLVGVNVGCADLSTALWTPGEGGEIPSACWQITVSQDAAMSKSLFGQGKKPLDTFFWVNEITGEITYPPPKADVPEASPASLEKPQERPRSQHGSVQGAPLSSQGPSSTPAQKAALLRPPKASLKDTGSRAVQGLRHCCAKAGGQRHVRGGGRAGARCRNPAPASSRDSFTSQRASFWSFLFSNTHEAAGALRLQAEISAPTGGSLPRTPMCVGIPSRPLSIHDPFGDTLKKLMDRIHDCLKMPELSQDYGTQNYEQQGDALLVHDTVRAVDALDLLPDFYDRERTTKTQVLQAERWLLVLFDDYNNELAHLATCSPENPKLEMLEQILREQFGSKDSPRGIIFTQTRQSTHSLLLWLQQQPGLQTMDIRADLLIGAGTSSQNTHMTQRDQQEVIRKFRVGTLHLLVASRVAEEGPDVPQCNVVVCYGLLTEISTVQARAVPGLEKSGYLIFAPHQSPVLDSNRPLLAAKYMFVLTLAM